MKNKDDPEGNYYILKRLKNKNRIERFKDEVRAGIELDHPNIVKVIDYETETDKPYIVMDYYKNKTLKNLNLEEYSIEEKLTIFKKICVAVAFAHDNGIIHRDLKPENILLNNDFEPVLGDFGLCFFDDSGERITVTDEAIGSRYFIAPELEDGKIDEIKATSDVYSLGKILYWIITGNIFSREELHNPKYDLTIDNSDSPNYLINEFLDKMIVKDPNNRFEDAKMVLNSLEILIKRINLGNNCIGPGIPQTCIYCGLGNYKIVTYYEEGDDGGVYQRGTSVENFGFSRVGYSLWMILVCEHCGNTQIFRPDYADDYEIWMK